MCKLEKTNDKINLCSTLKNTKKKKKIRKCILTLSHFG